MKQHHFKTPEGIPIYLIEPHASFEESLVLNPKTYGFVLIPHLINQTQWVGIILHYDEQNRLIDVHYCDPSLNPIPKNIMDRLIPLVPYKDPRLIMQSIAGVVSQEFSWDSGPCLISTLLSAVGYSEYATLSYAQRQMKYHHCIKGARRKETHDTKHYTRPMLETISEEDFDTSLTRYIQNFIVSLPYLSLPSNTITLLKNWLASALYSEGKQERVKQLRTSITDEFLIEIIHYHHLYSGVFQIKLSDRQSNACYKLLHPQLELPPIEEPSQKVLTNYKIFIKKHASKTPGSIRTTSSENIELTPR